VRYPSQEGIKPVARIDDVIIAIIDLVADKVMSGNVMPNTKLAHFLPGASRPHHSTVVHNNSSHINAQHPRTHTMKRQQAVAKKSLGSSGNLVAVSSTIERGMPQWLGIRDAMNALSVPQ
jgi:hypothetical protein